MSETARTCFVISAPSGAGKTSLADNLLGRTEQIERTISCTTRPPREGEVDGTDYFFVTPEQFEARIAAGEFLEWADVHGHRYGTLRAELARIHAADADAVMVIDVQGAAAVRRQLAEAVTVFVLPPSRRALVERLTGRDGLGGDPGRAQRLAIAAHEIAEYVGYDYLILNDVFERAAAELGAIVLAERCRRQRRSAEAEKILAAFRADAESPDS